MRQAVLLDRRALAEAVLRHGEESRAGVRQLGPDHLVARLQSDAFHAEGRSPHRPDLLLVETDGHALGGADDHVLVAVRVHHRDELVVVLDGQGLEAARPRPRERLQLGALDQAVLRDEDDVGPGRDLDRLGGDARRLRLLDLLAAGARLLLRSGLFRRLRALLLALLHRAQLFHRQQRRDLLVLRERDQVDDRLSSRGPACLGQFVHLEPEHPPLAGEDEHVVMRAGDEDLLDEVVVGGARAGFSAAAPPLRAVERHRIALDVPLVADGHHHVLFGDQVLVGKLARLSLDLGAARIGEEALHLAQLLLDHIEEQLLGAEDRRQPDDQGLHLRQLGEDLLLLQPGQALQLHLEDGLGLDLAQRVEALQLLRGLVARGARLDQRDDLVDVIERDLVAEQDVLALLGLAQVVSGAARDDVATMRDEPLQDRPEPERARLAAVDREHGRAERILEQRAVLVEIVEDDAGDGAALDLDDGADAFARRFVAQIRDAFDLLVVVHLADQLHAARLVHLVGHLGDHDALALGPLVGLDLHPGAHAQDAAARVVERPDGRDAQEDSAGGKVGTLDAARQRSAELRIEKLPERSVRMVDQVDDALDGLAQVVRRNVRRHPDRDACAAVDEQIGKSRGKDQRLGGRIIEVRSEVDGLLVDVGQHHLRQPRQTRLGVAVGRRWIAVDAAEVALPVDQGRAHVPVLRETHQGVVDGGVAVRVVLLQNFADGSGGLAVALVVQHPLVEHRVEDPAMDGLEAVADVGKRAPDDDGHRVVEIRLTHLVFDRDGNELGTGCFCHSSASGKDEVFYPFCRLPAIGNSGGKAA